MTSSAETQARELPSLPHKTPWLCVAGAKGGVGKTVLATNLALQFAAAGYRTLLIDFDPGTGNVGVHLRLNSQFDLDDVAAGRCLPEQAIVAGPSGLHVLLGRSGPTDIASMSPSQLASLLQDLRRTASGRYEVVVFDTGAGLNAATLAVAESSDVTLGVTTPEVTSLTDTYALCKVLHLRGCPQPQLVVNRVRSRDEAMRTATKLSKVTEKFLGQRSELCGWVCNDAAVERSTRQQRPLVISADANTAVANLALDDLRSTAAATLAKLPPLRRPVRTPAPPRLRARATTYGNSP